MDTRDDPNQLYDIAKRALRQLKLAERDPAKRAILNTQHDDLIQVGVTQAWQSRQRGASVETAQTHAASRMRRYAASEARQDHASADDLDECEGDVDVLMQGIDDCDGEGAASPPSPPRNLIHAELLHETRARVASLPQAERNAVTALYLRGETPGEAAELSGTTPSAVSHAARRGVARLRREAGAGRAG